MSYFVTPRVRGGSLPARIVQETLIRSSGMVVWERPVEVFMQRASWCALGTTIVVGLAGCAGAGDAASTGGGRGPTASASKPGGGSGTKTPTGDEPVVGGSDNPTFDPNSIVSPPQPDAGCMPGMRCYGTEADDPGCGTLKLEAEVDVIEHPGNVLLVFDTSGSMAMDWNGQQRWQAAGDAVKNALMPLQDMLTIGTVFFPRSDPNAPAVCIDPSGITCALGIPLYVQGGTCGVTPITSMDQINFVDGPTFLTTFAGPGGMTAPPYAPVPGGFTPLKEGLQQAQMALASATLTGITSVIVVTDGDPNCEWDNPAGSGVMVSNQIVTDWLAMGIKTYVIGLPGTTGAGDAVLTQLAQAGGTMQYITPADPATLEAKLREIATETVQQGFDSCTIGLNPAAEAPEKLLMIVEENGMRLNVPHDAGANGAGWTISTDGATVEITGPLCDDAMGGRFNAINFEFGCPDIPPPPPLPEVL